jgi:hypothetical protein
MLADPATGPRYNPPIEARLPQRSAPNPVVQLVPVRKYYVNGGEPNFGPNVGDMTER